MFLNPNIRNKLILKKKYMDEMDNNPFVLKRYIDDRVYLQESEKKSETIVKSVKINEKSKKNLPPDIEMMLPKNKLEDNQEIITEVVEDELPQNESIEISGELPEDLFGGGPLSSEERNNTKTIVVNHSFF